MKQIYFVFCLLLLLVSCPGGDTPCSHVWDWVETRAPTTTVEGEETYTCLLCGQTGTKRPIPAVPAIITSVKISIGEPLNGGTPSKVAATDDVGYTLSAVSWSPDDNFFNGGKSYTAFVTLTANNGYIFTGLNSAIINGQSAEISNNTGTTVTVSKAFTTPTKTPTGLTIKTQPSKLTYTHGEQLDLTGLVVTLAYDDTTADDIASENFAVRGINANPAQGDSLVHLTHNGQSVTVTYGGSVPFSANTGNLSVNPKVITFAVDDIPAQTYNGNAHTPPVTVRDGSTVLSLTADYTVAYTNNINEGTATVSITGVDNYAGSTGSGSFVINPAPITSAEIIIIAPVLGAEPKATADGTGNFSFSAVSWSPNHNPFRASTIYTASVTLTANNNYFFGELNPATINGQTASISDKTHTAVTLSYTFPTPTGDLEATNIAIKSQPSKLSYTHGDQLDLTGLVVTLTYNDTTKEDVLAASFIDKNITANPAEGNFLVHLTHDGKPVTVTYGSLAAVVTNNLIVSKADPVVTWPSGITAVYGQTLSQVSISGGSAIPAGTFTWTMPSASVGNAGSQSHSMTFTPNDAANYNTVANDITITVNKADPVVIWPSGITVVYGQTLSQVNITGGSAIPAGTFTWTAPSASVGNAGSQTHSMTFTPNDTANYNTVANDISITVNKADPVVTWPSGITAVYGQTLSQVGISGGSAIPTGTFTWTTPSNSAGNAGSQSHSMTFTPNDTANYNTVTNDITITVQLKVPDRFEYYWVNEHGSLVTTSGGITTIAAGEILTITAQSAGYVGRQWYLNGINTEHTGDTYNFSSITAGQHTVGLFVEKDGRPYNINIIITVMWVVTYDINGGTGATPASQIVSAGSSITLPSGSGLSRPNLIFGGWNTNTTGTGTNYEANTYYSPNGSITLYAKWIIITENFEGTSSFTLVNGSETNQWRVGTATSYSGTRSAYISNNNGTSNAYTLFFTSIVHMYRDVTFPASSVPYTLSFYWKCQGEGTRDYLRVSLVNTTVTLTAGSTTSLGTALGTYNLGGTGWNQAIISIPASNSGLTRRLVFTWVNDSSLGTQPPVAVDNIELRIN